MSVKATSFVRRLRGLDATEKAVAFVLADHSSHKGAGSYPSMETVAEEAALASRQSASRVVQRLADYKIIVSDNPSKGGKTTVWDFNYGLQGCPPAITLAAFNRVPKSQSNRNREDAVDRIPGDAVQDKATASQKKATASQNKATASPGMQEGVEPKSKGTTKAGEEAEESLRSRVAASATRIIQAFEMLHVYGGEIYGSPAFQLEWLAAVEDSRFHGGDVLAAFEDKQWEHFKARLPLAIERCIQSCNRKAIKPPGAFYEDAKHARHHSGRFNARGR